MPFVRLEPVSSCLPFISVMPPSGRKPGNGSPNIINSRPWLRCMPSTLNDRRRGIGDAERLVDLEQAAKVAANLPKSTLAPSSNWVESSRREDLARIARAAGAVGPCCMPWM